MNKLPITIDHSTSIPSIDVNLDNAFDITRLYLKSINLPALPFSVVRVRVSDRLRAIDVTVRFVLPVGRAIESTTFIPVDFWVWAEARIEFENTVLAA